MVPAQSSRARTSFLLLATLLPATVISVVLYQGVIRPIDRLKDVVKRMGEGDIPEIPAFRTTEVDEMAQSVRKLAKGLHDTTAFAQCIGGGDFAASFTTLSDKDILGDALLSMRDNLRQAARQEEETKWANAGYTRSWTFSAATLTHPKDWAPNCWLRW